MSDESQILVLQLLFTAFYGGSFSALLRRADLWFPFTQTFTAATGQWVGWQDALRWVLAFSFLIFIPAIVFAYVQLVLLHRPPLISINLLPPSLSDFWTIAVVLSLIAPQLGFYNFWQVLMRSLPKIFYSEQAIRTIEEHYPNAFKAGHGATLAWGMVWIFVPIMLLSLTILLSGSK